MKIAGTIYLCWGLLVFFDGIADSLFWEPEANKFSLTKWEFISYVQWQNYARFEMVYGLSCIIIGLLVWQYRYRLPEFIVRNISIDHKINQVSLND